jgi:class 3 adenylate cyclase
MDKYRVLYQRAVRNLLAGTALSIVPAGAFYFFVFPYTPKQLAVLAVLAVVDLAAFLPLDIFILKHYLKPVERAFADAANPIKACAGLARLLELPRIALWPRIFGFHAVSASVGLTLLVIAANRWFALGIAPHTFPLYWILNLTVVPIAHAVYEFAATERAIQAPALALSAHTRDAMACARPFDLRAKMRVFFPLLAFAPMAILVVSVYEHAEHHWGLGGESMHLLKDMVAIGLASAVLFLYLMYALGSQLESQTEELIRTLDRLGRGELDARTSLFSSDEFGQIAAHVNTMAAGLGERERLRDLFGAYMTPAVAQSLLAAGEDAGKTEKRYVAILFLDVRGFTAFANQTKPDVVVSVLNRFFEGAVDAVARNQGTLNKYLGDGFLAIFGAPGHLENPCAAAIDAALDIAKGLRGLNHLFAATGVPPMKIGIGIHAGEVVVGTIGSPKHKLEYTVIGDAVNVAARIEQLNKELGTEILVSDEVFAHAIPQQQLLAQVALDQKVRGVVLPVRVYPLELEAKQAASN